MIEITCPVCDIIYHADESHTGRGFRCRLCGRILKVERPPSQLKKVEPAVMGHVIETPPPRLPIIRKSRKGVMMAAAAVLLVIGLGIGYRELSQFTPQPAPAPATLPPVNADLRPIPQIPSIQPIDEKKVLGKLKPIATLKTPVHTPPLEPAKFVFKWPPKSEPSRIDFRSPSLTTTPAPATTARLAPLVIIPACAKGQQPETHFNGDSIEEPLSMAGRSKLVVSNGLSEDGAVRLANASTKQTVRFVYIRAHDEYTITGIEPGIYTLMFLQGHDWIANCRFFLHNLRIQRFREPLEFGVTREQQAGGVLETYSGYEISLNPSPLGTAKTEEIDLSEFYAGDVSVSVAQ